MTKRWVATRTMATVAMVACAVTSLSLWRSSQPEVQRIAAGRASKTVMAQAFTSIATEPAETRPSELATASLGIASVEAVEAPSVSVNETVAAPAVSAAARMDRELAAAFEKTQSLPAEVALPEATSTLPALAVSTSGDVASGDVALGDVAFPETTIAPTITPAEIAMDPSFAEPVAAIDPLGIEDAVETSPVVSTSLASNDKWPVPDNDAVAATLAQWNIIAQTLAPHDLTGRYDRAIEFAEDTPAAVTPAFEALRRWVGYTQAASAAVLTGEHAEADRATYRLLDGFDIDEWAVTKSVLALSVSADMRERDAKLVGEWLSHWAARALGAGNLADAAFFNQQIDSVTRGIENQSLHTSTNEFRKTLTTAGRLAEVVQRLETEYPEDGSGDLISPSDHYAAGRYWALIRRDWPRSIMHLSAGSDMRLANLANKESQLSEMPSMSDLLELAKAYAAMAEKSKGWIHDSYLLHADELLSRSDAIGSSSDSLELARYQKFLRSEHEAVFAFAEQMKRPNPEFARD